MVSQEGQSVGEFSDPQSLEPLNAISLKALLPSHPAAGFCPRAYKDEKSYSNKAWKAQIINVFTHNSHVDRWLPICYQTVKTNPAITDNKLSRINRKTEQYQRTPWQTHQARLSVCQWSHSDLLLVRFPRPPPSESPPYCEECSLAAAPPASPGCAPDEVKKV